MKKNHYVLSAAILVAAGALTLILLWRNAPQAQIASEMNLTSGGREARYWTRIARNSVHCFLCPHECIIPVGSRGRCNARENRAGVLYSLVYARPVAIGISPIEKAPFKHFHPGHERLTIATVGCNLRCRHCQNWQISQATVEEVQYELLSPQQVIAGVQRAGLRSVSFTYTEPTVFFEYMYDIAKLAQAQGIKTTLVTNGFINPEPLRDLLQHMDAVRVDLKAFTEDFYRTVSGGTLAPVLQTLKIIQEEGVWLEIINLMIPTVNDHPEDLRAMCEWILANLGPDVPLHFNRFHPAFRMTHLPPTPVKTLEMAHRIATEVGINFVTLGNLPGHRYGNTFCPGCGKRLIHRIGFSILANHIAEGKCRFCDKEISGVW